MQDHADDGARGNFGALPLPLARDCAPTLATCHAAEWTHRYADRDEARVLREVLAERVRTSASTPACRAMRLP